MAFDYSNLDPEQSKTALKVLNAAEKYGLNPEFVLPMVMGESRFKHIPSDRKNKDGTPVAHGVMMLTPGLAKQYGVNDYQKADEDTNIEVGMKYLRDLASNPKIGNDAKKLLAGYNAGPASKFVQTGDEKDLLDETRNHIKNVTAYSAGDELATPTLKSNEDDVYAELHQKPNEEQKNIDDEVYGDLHAGTPATQSEPLPTTSGRLGAGLGFAAGAASAVAPAIIKKGASFLGFEGEPQQDLARVEPTIDESGMSPGEKWGTKTGYGMGEGSVADVNQRYKRAAASKESKIVRRQEAKFGVPQPGESKDIVQRLIDSKNEAERIAKEAAVRSQLEQQATLNAARAQPTGGLGSKVLGTLGEAFRTGLGGLVAGYQAQTGANTEDPTEKGLRYGAAGASLADLGATLFPTALKTAARTVTAPLTIGLSTAADVKKDLNKGDVSGALGSGAIGASAFIPGVGVPTAAYLQWAKDNPEQAANVRNQLSDIAPFIGP